MVDCPYLNAYKKSFTSLALKHPVSAIPHTLPTSPQTAASANFLLVTINLVWSAEHLADLRKLKSPAHCRIHPISLVVEHLHGLCIAFRIGINKEYRFVAGCHDVAAIRCPCRILPGTGRCDCPGGRFSAVRSRCHDEPLAGLKRGP